MKAYGFTMKRGNVTIETFVYSEHGKDIENRFLILNEEESESILPLLEEMFVEFEEIDSTT